MTQVWLWALQPVVEHKDKVSGKVSFMSKPVCCILLIPFSPQLEFAYPNLTLEGKMSGESDLKLKINGPARQQGGLQEL